VYAAGGPSNCCPGIAPCRPSSPSAAAVACGPSPGVRSRVKSSGGGAGLPRDGVRLLVIAPERWDTTTEPALPCPAAAGATASCAVVGWRPVVPMRAGISAGLATMPSARASERSKEPGAVSAVPNAAAINRSDGECWRICPCPCDEPTGVPLPPPVRPPCPLRRRALRCPELRPEPEPPSSPSWPSPPSSLRAETGDSSDEPVGALSNAAPRCCPGIASTGPTLCGTAPAPVAAAPLLPLPRICAAMPIVIHCSRVRRSAYKLSSTVRCRPWLLCCCLNRISCNCHEYPMPAYLQCREAVHRTGARAGLLGFVAASRDTSTGRRVGDPLPPPTRRHATRTSCCCSRGAHGVRALVKRVPRVRANYEIGHHQRGNGAAEYGEMKGRDSR
jgi:hypothetical protein